MLILRIFLALFAKIIYLFELAKLDNTLHCMTQQFHISFNLVLSFCDRFMGGRGLWRYAG